MTINLDSDRQTRALVQQTVHMIDRVRSLRSHLANFRIGVTQEGVIAALDGKATAGLVTVALRANVLKEAIVALESVDDAINALDARPADGSGTLTVKLDKVREQYGVRAEAPSASSF